MNIGLALGGGAARGWAHIGIIEALEGMGIMPSVICGTSIGALVGASCAAGNLDRLKGSVLSLTRLGMMSYFNISTSLSTLVRRDKLQELFENAVVPSGVQIEDLPLRYAAVATELATGRELWLKKGDVLQAVWASIALPGLFPPVWHKRRWLVDGGLVNPVPVSVCRALGADMVIAVNLNGDIVGRHISPEQREPEHDPGVIGRVAAAVRRYSRTGQEDGENGMPERPGTLDTVFGAVDIMQERITRSRMAGDPPDVLLVPRVGSFSLMEFYKAEEAIRAGERCVESMRPVIEAALAR